VTRRGPARAGAVALTFDDGPHPEGTPAVLAELDRLGLRETFYVVGSQARRYPARLRDVVAAGHELGLHGGRHLPHGLVPPVLLERGLGDARAEIDRVQEMGGAVAAVESQVGSSPDDATVSIIGCWSPFLRSPHRGLHCRVRRAACSARVRPHPSRPRLRVLIIYILPCPRRAKEGPGSILPGPGMRRESADYVLIFDCMAISEALLQAWLWRPPCVPSRDQ